MKKFIINYVKQTSIVEVKVEIVLPMEDISVMWLKEGEWKGKVIQPTSTYEKHPVSGKLTPPIWCWHVFYDSPEECFLVLRSRTRDVLLKYKTQETIKKAQEAIKNGHKLEEPIEINEEDLLAEVEEVISKIQVVYLQ